MHSKSSAQSCSVGGAKGDALSSLLSAAAPAAGGGTGTDGQPGIAGGGAPAAAAGGGSATALAARAKAAAPSSIARTVLDGAVLPDCCWWVRATESETGRGSQRRSLSAVTAQ